MRAAIGATAAAAVLLSPLQGGLWPALAALNLCWATGFAVLAIRYGLTAPLVIGEVLLTALACLWQGELLPVAALGGGVSWVAGLVSMSMVVLNLAWPVRRAAPVCGILVLCHLVGARHAGAADGGVCSAGIQLLQVVAIAAMTSLLRRAADLADGAFAELRSRQRRVAEEQTRRQEEQRRSDELHGTVLATLTVVAGAGVPSDARLRQHAERAASVLAALQADPDPALTDPVGTETATMGTPGAAVRLDIAMQHVVAGVDLTVWTELAAVFVPPAVAEAVVTAVEELLANVGKHAGTDTAHLTLTRSATGFALEVTDEGVGFDPSSVLSHRYGLNHAVRAAIAAAGGVVDIRSGPRSGTRVQVRWPC
jgi:signal transduction histidine kinase